MLYIIALITVYQPNFDETTCRQVTDEYAAAVIAMQEREPEKFEVVYTIVDSCPSGSCHP